MGNGRSIRVFHDEWIPKIANPLKGSPLSVGLPTFKLSNLFYAQCREWRQPLLNVLFPMEVVGAIIISQFRRWRMSLCGSILRMVNSQLSLHICFALRLSLVSWLDGSDKDFNSGAKCGGWVCLLNFCYLFGK